MGIKERLTDKLASHDDDAREILQTVSDFIEQQISDRLKPVLAAIAVSGYEFDDATSEGAADASEKRAFRDGAIMAWEMVSGKEWPPVEMLTPEEQEAEEARRVGSRSWVMTPQSSVG
jgi:hypothetical protein